MRRQRIAIVGAGPVGLTAALALRQVGFEVALFEKGHALQQPGGGCVIHSNGLRVLDALGQFSLVAPLMRYTRRMAVEQPVGVRLATFDYGTLPIIQNRAACLGRNQLLDYLLSAVEWAQIPVIFGRRCTRVDMHGAVCSVEFAHGAPYDCDIVIAADGAHSAVCDAVGLAASASAPGLAFVHGLVAHHTVDATVREIRTADGRSCTIYPLLGERTAFACSVPVASWRSIMRDGVEPWIESWAAHSAEVGTLLRAVDDWKAVGYAEVHEVVRAQWSRGPVFAIGDAAHAMTPFLGQGISAGMADALVLAQLLAAYADDDLAAVGAQYQALREPVVRRMQRESAKADLGWRPRSLFTRLLHGGRAAPTVDWRDEQLGVLAAGYNAAEEPYFQAMARLAGPHGVAEA